MKLTEEQLRKLAKELEESQLDEQTSMDTFNSAFKNVEKSLAEERKKKLKQLLGE
jgi:SpoVK/Ycf46/Vps4 family AAA+-type ATPase